MTSVNDKIVELSHSIHNIELQISKLKSIQNKFNKFEVCFYDGRRFKDGICFTQEVNDIATHVDFYTSCSCCADAALYCSPYVLFDGNKVYCDPIEYHIGDCAFNGGYYFEENYLNVVKNKNISSRVIEIIEEYKSKNSYEAFENLGENESE